MISYIKTIFSLFLAVIFISSCMTVVDIETKTAVQRLVIEADLSMIKDSTNVYQTIKLTQTADYYTNKLIPATGADVSITLSNGTTFNFLEGQPGTYYYVQFEANFLQEYTLDIIYEEEHYQAKNKFVAVPAIEGISQDSDYGSEDDENEISITFQDPFDIDNFFYIDFLIGYTNSDNLPAVDSTFNIWDDTYEEGNLLWDYYEDETIVKGSNIRVYIKGLSREYYNFINLLNQQENAAPGPFSSPPVNVKGNCVNLTNPSHYPYGYFNLSEQDRINYIYQ